MRKAVVGEDREDQRLAGALAGARRQRAAQCPQDEGPPATFAGEATADLANRSWRKQCVRRRMSANSAMPPSSCRRADARDTRALRYAGFHEALPIVLGIGAELEARNQPAHSLQGEPGLEPQHLGDFRTGTVQLAELCAGRGQKYARKSR